MKNVTDSATFFLLTYALIMNFAHESPEKKNMKTYEIEGIMC